MDEQIIVETVETVFELIMRKMFGMYFIQIVSAILLLSLLFSGRLIKLWDWLLSFRKVKIGDKVTLEGAGAIIDKGHGKNNKSDSVKKEILDVTTDNEKQCLNDGCIKFEKLANSVDSINTEITEIRLQLSKLDEHQDETWTLQLKDTFYSTHMPVYDRMISGLKYVWWIESKGLKNGNTKNDVIGYAYENLSIYLTATKLRPELQLEELEKRK